MTYRTFDGTSQTETIVDGRFSSSGDIALADGTATQGAIYFADDKNTGIYSPSNDQIAFTTAGTAALTIGSDNAATFAGALTAGNLTYNNTDTLSIDHSATNENSYIKIAADDNRRKTLVFESGGTIRGVVGVGDSDEASATSLFLAANNDVAGNTPHIVIDSTGNSTFSGHVTIPSKASTYEGITLSTPSGDGNGEFHIGVHQAGSSSGRAIVFKRGGTDGCDTESMRITAAGNVSINDGNLVVASSRGVIFSAYDESTGDGNNISSNTLDDYEEGIWSPIIAGTGGSGGLGGTQSYHSSTYGSYTKIGNLVHCSFRVHFDGTTGANGNPNGSYIQLKGFPFNLASDPDNTSISTPIYYVNLGNNYIMLGLQGAESGSEAFVWAKKSATSSREYLSIADVEDNSEFTGTFSYRV
jgi:hypothetical protein